MSHIVSFRIDGLVGRKDPYAQTLNRDINIFFGLNGSGKTSLLKILHSGMSGDAAMLKSVPFDRAEVVFYSIQEKRNLRRTFEKPDDKSRNQMILDLAEAVEAPVAVPVRTTLSQSIHTARLRNDWYTFASWLPSTPWTGHDEQGSETLKAYQHGYLPTSRLYLTDDDSRVVANPAGGSTAGISEEQLDRYFGRAMEGLWLRYAANILSGVRTAQESGLGRILQNILATEKRGEKPTPLKELNSDVAYQRVKSFLTRQGSHRALTSAEDFKKRYSREQRLLSVVAEIDAVEQGIEVVMAPRFKLQALIQHMFSGNKQITFSDQAIAVTTADSKNIGLEALSSGEKHLLRLFVEALLVGPSSILVDEPELSLHVDWQRQLIADFRLLNNEAQLVFATHSPEVMADVDDSSFWCTEGAGIERAE